MNSIADNAQFFSGFATVATDVVMMPYNLPQSRDFSLEGFFPNTSNLHYAMGGAKNWIDGQFPRAPDAFNRIVRGSSYWATEAGIITLTVGGAALKHINSGAEFLGKGLGKSYRTIFQTNKANLLKEANYYSESANQSLMLKKRFASLEQMSEKGTIIAGHEAEKAFRTASFIAEKYGGRPNEWVKKSSGFYRSSDGFLIETHWIENVKTGKRIEYKTKVKK